MSTENNNNDNTEEIYTGEETAPNNTTPLPPSSGFNFGSHPNGAIPGFGEGVAMGAFSASSASMGAFSRPPFTTTAGGFGGGVAMGAFSASMGAFSRPPSTTTAGGFGTFGGLQPTGMGGRVERHPETGQPIPMGCNLMPPQSACGGIRNSHPGSSQNYPLPFGQRLNEPTILNSQSNKKKSIDDLYKKLASARAQIQALNKVIDEIYETLPNIN